MSLHDRIIGQLPDDITRESEAFYEGFAEASRKASQLAKEADDLMAEMAEALTQCESVIHDKCPASLALAKYNAWKEQNK